MGVYFMFTDTEDNLIYKDYRVQNSGCWGILKGFDYKFQKTLEEAKEFFKLKKMGENLSLYPYTWREGIGPHHYGVPIYKKESMRYLRVYTHNRDLRFKELYEEVIKPTPVWFKDFTYHEKDEEGRDYLRVDLSCSTLRNYNALMMIRNLLYDDYEYKSKDLSPIDRLFLSERFLGINRRYTVSDSNTVPMVYLEGYESILERLERGPLLEQDVPLDSIPITPEDVDYFMSLAFLSKEEHEMFLTTKDEDDIIDLDEDPYCGSSELFRQKVEKVLLKRRAA